MSLMVICGGNCADCAHHLTTIVPKRFHHRHGAQENSSKLYLYRHDRLLGNQHDDAFIADVNRQWGGPDFVGVLKSIPGAHVAVRERHSAPGTGPRSASESEAGGNGRIQ
jgi:hypothetical protein